MVVSACMVSAASVRTIRSGREGGVSSGGLSLKCRFVASRMPTKRGATLRVQIESAADNATELSLRIRWIEAGRFDDACHGDQARAPDAQHATSHRQAWCVGSEPKHNFTDSQSLVIDGKQHSADILAAVYLDPESADYIQPGLAIDIETPFDVPVGSTPESVVLSDIAQPRGVTVDLTGAPIATS